ncbi:hypothetical protein QQF64_035956, partial [Cirrhinus molitorella]
MNQTDLANTLQTKLMPVYQQKLKSRLQDKYQRIKEELDEFILTKYDRSEECLLRLLPVIKASTKVDL